jgi:hypothetical protein
MASIEWVDLPDRQLSNFKWCRHWHPMDARGVDFDFTDWSYASQCGQY